MSIYCSMPDIDGSHCPGRQLAEDEETPLSPSGLREAIINEDGTFAVKDDQCPGCDYCDVGAPYAYDGSHIIVGPGSRRGGSVHWAVPATHIATAAEQAAGVGYVDERENGYPHHGYIRFGVQSADPLAGDELQPGMADVVLDRRQVAYLHAQLGEWLEQDFVDDGFPS